VGVDGVQPDGSRDDGAPARASYAAARQVAPGTHPFTAPGSTPSLTLREPLC
jgi:hypothetical protein